MWPEPFTAARTQLLDRREHVSYCADDTRKRMASASPVRESPLQPENWIQAAFLRLSAQGVEAVRVELLARDLGATKGSFYWHFKDREDLLSRVMLQWEQEEMQWLEAAQEPGSGAAVRWARFIERSANLDRARLEISFRAWARRDNHVAIHVATIEAKRRAHVASVLRDVGFTPSTAEKWSELALLAYLGWIDKSTRDPEFHVAGRGLGEYLSDLILAASAPADH
jgi:AcrR family transcriptional regulator